LEGFWICPSFKDRFLSRRAKPNITIRNFSSPYHGLVAPCQISAKGRFSF
jgi:hypothetical protein